ncbi:hypothetical protein QJS66_10445 [Kocuria rhizophila]|nr:hypothetical protein QJS66_10445 [Kocuria rhizophila]
MDRSSRAVPACGGRRSCWRGDRRIPPRRAASGSNSSAGRMDRQPSRLPQSPGAPTPPQHGRAASSPRSWCSRRRTSASAVAALMTGTISAPIHGRAIHVRRPGHHDRGSAAPRHYHVRG